MDDNLSLIALDAGNTSVKIGVFSSGKLAETFRVPLDQLAEWKSQQKNVNQLPVVVSSVIDTEQNGQLRTIFPEIHLLNQQVPLPFFNGYTTPETIGMDRLCNVAAVSDLSNGKSRLVIDIGTCIKFDFLDGNNVYLGGSISPGLRLRYTALHEFTGRLPLLHAANEKIPLIGNSTQQAIRSGVQNGLNYEIHGMIADYRNKYPDLTIFVTGGDLAYFDFEGKNDIFVDENLTLKGIYAIYSFHAH